jgi:lathosterol oxidase
MDIVLEVVDRIIFDPIYAYLLPFNPNYSGLKSVFHNQTASSLGESSLGAPLFNDYVYKPASAYFQVPPGQYAFMTSVQRDDPFRQLLSLYLITWLVQSTLYA